MSFYDILLLIEGKQKEQKQLCRLFRSPSWIWNYSNKLVFLKSLDFKYYKNSFYFLCDNPHPIPITKLSIISLGNITCSVLLPFQSILYTVIGVLKEKKKIVLFSFLSYHWILISYRIQSNRLRLALKVLHNLTTFYCPRTVLCRGQA